MSHAKQSDFHGVPCSLNGFEHGEENIAEQTQLYGTQDLGQFLGEISLFSSGLGYYRESPHEEEFLSKYQQENKVLSDPDFDDLQFDVVSPSNEFSPKEIAKLKSILPENSELVESKKEELKTCPLTSLGLIKHYRSRFTESNGGKLTQLSNDAANAEVHGQQLSTNDIIRLAGEMFIQSHSEMVDHHSVLSRPYASSFTGISDEEARGMELVRYLLASAEYAGQQQFERAIKFINQCDELSSIKGDPVQRLVYCFSKALREKIGLETGRIASKGFGKKQSLDLEERMMNASSSCIKFHQEVPFSSVCQFTGIQMIIDGLSEAKKIHIIDLEIRNGMQFTVLMQALAARRDFPLEHLKITAISTKSKPSVEKTRKWLMSFAESLNLPFSFNVVMVADMLDLKEDLFEVDPEEEVAVYSAYVLSTMISRPGQLECLMRVIRNINPCVIVISEVEANHNSPVFVRRFVEALFYYGALFDSMEECMDRDDANRVIAESVNCRLAISNIVATEGEERTFRHVTSSVWKTFFARFGLVETELSKTSLYQASLVVKNFACGDFCTLDMVGKSLSIGWKGTPIFSISALKFL